MSPDNINYSYYQRLWSGAAKYLDKSAGSRWFYYLLTYMLGYIENSSIGSIIDIGCGVGNKTAFLATMLPKSTVIGIDFSESGIEEANKQYSLDNLSFKVSDVTIDINHNEADLVTIFEVLEHIEEWLGVLTSIVAHTHPRYVMISGPTGKMYSGGIHTGHFRHFKKGEIEEEMQGLGYRTIKALYAGFPFVSPIFRDLSFILSKQYDSFTSSSPSNIHKAINAFWYFLFRYLSTIRFGNQFIGLFMSMDIDAG